MDRTRRICSCIDSQQLFSFFSRYELLYHQFCAVGCPTAMPNNEINVNLSKRYVVTNLSPFTMYSFRIRVYNSRYSGLSDVAMIETQAIGNTIVFSRSFVTGVRGLAMFPTGKGSIHSRSVVPLFSQSVCCLGDGIKTPARVSREHKREAGRRTVT